MSDNKSLAANAFFAKKIGMTRVFDSNGASIPVTVVKLIVNVVSQVKTSSKDGYDAYQVAYGSKRSSLINKPVLKHLEKAGVESAFSKLSELKVEKADELFLGKELSLELFSEDTFVDVTGISKGKGFQGVMKRYNFSGGPAAHGSKFHRTPGSIGMSAYPGRVLKNKKMPGHMGVNQKTIQNLKVVELNMEKGYMLIKGSVPGSKNGFVKIAKSLKK